MHLSTLSYSIVLSAICANAAPAMHAEMLPSIKEVSQAPSSSKSLTRSNTMTRFAQSYQPYYPIQKVVQTKNSAPPMPIQPKRINNRNTVWDVYIPEHAKAGGMPTRDNRRTHNDNMNEISARLTGTLDPSKDKVQSGGKSYNLLTPWAN